jgi:cell division protein FtsB
MAEKKTQTEELLERLSKTEELLEKISKNLEDTNKGIETNNESAGYSKDSKMSEPKVNETKPSETKPRKVVGRSVTIALGIICILLIAFIAYFSVTGISAQNSYDKLQNQNKQLQTWVDGNETLLMQTQANNTNLQNQIDSLNSSITNLQNQVNDLNATVNLAKSTSWGNYTLDSGAISWTANTYANFAGYVSFVASSSSAFNVSVELSYALSNGINYDRTAYVGSESLSLSSHTYEDSAWFPILPGGVKVTVTNLSPYASVRTEATYFY